MVGSELNAGALATVSLTAGDEDPPATLARCDCGRGIAAIICAQADHVEADCYSPHDGDEQLPTEAWAFACGTPRIKRFIPNCEAYAHQSNSAAAIHAILGIDYRPGTSMGRTCGQLRRKSVDRLVRIPAWRGTRRLNPSVKWFQI